MALKIILIVLASLFTGLFLFARVTKGGLYGLLTKIVASLGFMAIAICGAVLYFPSVSSLFIVFGLLFGLVGDIVLDLKVIYKEHNDVYLNAGMLSFGLGHVCYFVALFTYVSNHIMYKSSSLPMYIPILVGVGVAVILSLGVLFSTKKLKLDFGKFFFQSVGYTILLTNLSAISICLATFYGIGLLWLFGMGATLILVSDLILSLNYFGGKPDDKLLVFLNHLIYYAGQILIATFLLF